jgi:hypothetical protein
MYMGWISVWYSLLMLLQTRDRRPRVVSKSGDKPTLERRAAEVSRGIEDGKPIVASCTDAPAMRTRENIRRNSQPLLIPNPWRIHKSVLKRQAGVYIMSSTIERSFLFDSVITVDSRKVAEVAALRLYEVAFELSWVGKLVDEFLRGNDQNMERILTDLVCSK